MSLEEKEMYMEECKAAAVKHWEGNIIALRDMDWAWWTKLRMCARRRASRTFASGLPFIYGDLCPYCQVFSGRCEDCPLNDVEEDDMCCEAWIGARDAFVEKPTTREHALEAFQRMLDYIKEKD